jgi:hypothetical protein
MQAASVVELGARHSRRGAHLCREAKFCSLEMEARLGFRFGDSRLGFRFGISRLSLKLGFCVYLEL